MKCVYFQAFFSHLFDSYDLSLQKRNEVMRARRLPVFDLTLFLTMFQIYRLHL